VVEVAGVEVVDHHAVAARADEGVGVDVLVEERLDRRHVLVGEVAAEGAMASDRIVGCADARQQHQPHVVKLECGDDDNVCQLLDFTPLRIEIGAARRRVSAFSPIDQSIISACTHPSMM
jgi:hypothetical protein